MNSLKEKKILVRMKQRLGEDVPQELLDEIAAEEASIAADLQRQEEVKQERKEAFKSVFGDLSSQLKHLMAEEKKKTAEEQALLDRFANVMSRVDEIKSQIAERKEQTTEEFIEEIIPQTIEMIPEEIVETTSIILAPEEPPVEPPIKDPIKDVAKNIKVTKPASAFVQPDPPPVSRDIKDIQNKLKLLEGWVSKISMTGPGGGAVWLRDLDDVARSSVLGATDGQVLTYNETLKKWTAQDSAAANGGYTLPTASTTVKGGVKIDGTTITINNQVISANIPAQVQADWTEANNTLPSYIKNKPSVVTDITSVDNTVQISANANGVHDLSVAASLSTSVDKVFAYVTNDDSVTIHKGDPVYLYRATGNRPSVILAKSTSDAYSAKTLGLASQDINPGNPGWVQTQGVLTGVDTSAYAEGDTLYLSPTAGVMTNVKPYAPQHLVYMGVVVRANQGQGQIYIRPQNGYELDEIHDVNINHNVALANGHTIVYNSTNSLWENQSLSGLVATYTANNASFVGTVSAANVVSNSQLSSNLANYQTTAGLSANVATLASNNASYLGGIAAAQYAYANQITTYTLPTANTTTLGGVKVDGTTITITAGVISSPNQDLSGYQTTAGLSSNVATLTANNTSFVGTVSAANVVSNTQLSSNLANYQTTAGLSANVATLSSNNSLYLGGVAAASYVANTDSRTLSGNLTFTGLTSMNYTGAGSTSSLSIGGYNSKGGTGYHDFLKVTNGYGSATNPTKWFRLDSTGTLQIINSGYTAQLLTLSDAGDMTVLGNITSSGAKSGYSSGRPGFRVYGSGTTNNLTTTQNTYGFLNSNNFATDFNQGSYLNTTTGLFTAPVAGLYQVNLVCRNAGNAAYSQLAVVKNTGVNYAGGSVAVMIEYAGSSTMNHTGGSTVLQMAVNDTICIKVLAGTINFDANDNWSVAYIG